MGVHLRSRGKAASGTGASSDAAEESLEELATLAESAGAEVCNRVLQTRSAPDPATLIGSGKLDEVSQLAAGQDADVVIFDSDLTPTQQRNIEQKLDRRIVDRTQLILDIFASRARTREGQLQVELAQLSYLLPRLTGRGIEMSRLGGGIGTRGPGETQLETDRRRISGRIQKIKLNLEKVRANRSVQRRQRQAVPLATVALAGYTNAGKSTLFNVLTRAGVTADARMFATLDPTVRHVVLPSRRRALLGDTVGFIRSLPTTLVEAFRATLEEVTEAELILHVVDAASPHAAEHTRHVLKVLAEIGAGQTQQILVLNKADLLAGEDIDALGQRLIAGAGSSGVIRTVAVSARTGSGMPALLEAIDQALPVDPLLQVRLRFPSGEGQVAHLVHEWGRVISAKHGARVTELEAEIPESLRRRLSKYLV